MCDMYFFFKPIPLTNNCLFLMADIDKITNNLTICILKRSSLPVVVYEHLRFRKAKMY